MTKSDQIIGPGYTGSVHWSGLWSEILVLNYIRDIRDKKSKQDRTIPEDQCLILVRTSISDHNLDQNFETVAMSRNKIALV